MWDEQPGPWRDSLQYVVGALLERRVKPDEWVLDAGCGTGNYAIALAKEEFSVIGTDFATGMLTKARQKTPEDLAGRVTFKRADLNTPLEFDDARFDHLISISVLQAVADPFFILSEFHRVLKPGGTLLLSLPRPNDGSRSFGELVRYRLCHLKRRTACESLLVVVKACGDRFYDNPSWTAQQARYALASAGFEVLAVGEGQQIIVVAEKVHSNWDDPGRCNGSY
ncbi:MAG: class I SAM-dependent methyltransferase [Anaerolineae bacterium]|nr:class I SAM-dependent methyltransferase [Anaerolineae bacterium]